MRKDCKGVISIFLALILMPTYLFTIGALDISRVYAAKNYLKLANEASIQSQLLSYNKKLFNRYGLFAVTNESEIKERNGKVIKENLLISNSNENLNNLRLLSSTVDLNKDSNLCNTKILEKQIVEYMKLRAPYKMVNGFLNLLKVVKTSSTYNKVLSKKMNYNSSLEDFNDDLIKWRDSFTGYNSDSTKLNELVLAIGKSYKSFKDENQKLESKIGLMEYKKIDLSKMKNEDLADLFNKLMSKTYAKKIYKISKLTDSSNSIDEDKENEDRFLSEFKKIKDTFFTLFEVIRKHKFTYEIEINNKSVDIIPLFYKINTYRFNLESKLKKDSSARNEAIKKELIEIANLRMKLAKSHEIIKAAVTNINSHNNKLDQSLNEWKDSINTVKDKEIKNQFLTEYTFTNKKYSKSNIQAFLDALQKNNDNLEKIDSLISGKDGLIFKLENDSESAYKYDTKAFESINKLNNLQKFAIYKGVVNENKLPKISNEEKSEAKNIKNTLLNFNKTAGKKEEIPSKDNLLNYISEVQLENILKDSKSINNKLIDSRKQKIENNKDFNNLLDEINANSSIDNEASLFKDILIVQYIDDKFSDKTSISDSVFKGQKEYVIFGSKSLDENIKRMKAFIFTTRMGLNTIYAFTSPKLRREALGVATAIAGWTGVGVPLVESLVLAMMSLGESIIDTDKLYDGNDVEAFKNNATWQVSITGIKKLLEKKAESMVKDGIDNIFNRVEEIAIEAVDDSYSTIDEFISQTQDGLVDALSGTVILPIQNKIVSIISEPVENIKAEFSKVFEQVRSSISDEQNPVMKNLKLNLITKVESKVNSELIDKLESIDDMANDYLISFIEKISNELEEFIKTNLKSVADNMKLDIKRIATEKKQGYQEKICESINKYLGIDKRKSDEKPDMFSSSGLSFSYGDYTKLICLFMLNRGNRQAILSRIAAVIDIEMKKEEAEFSVLDSYVDFKIKTKIVVPMIIDLKVFNFRDKEIKDEMEMSF